MNAVIARGPSAAGQLVFLWPEPIPWGTELRCGDEEVVVVCPDWEVGEQLGPGSHTLNLSKRATHILAYFIRTSPMSVGFDHVIQVFDRKSGAMAGVRYAGSIAVQVGEPILLCKQVIGVPAHDLGTGVVRSVSNSITKALEVMIHKLISVNPGAGALTNANALSQLVTMTASGNPMAIAVSGIDFLGFEHISLSVDGATPIHANVNSALIQQTSIAEGPVQSAVQPVENDSTPIPSGTSVLVYWTDGRWHSGVVRSFRDGGYDVNIDGSTAPTWVQASHVRLTL